MVTDGEEIISIAAENANTAENAKTAENIENLVINV